MTLLICTRKLLDCSMNEQPKEITVCNLECILMPNGEIMSLGKTIGFFKDYKKYLKRKDE